MIKNMFIPSGVIADFRNCVDRLDEALTKSATGQCLFPEKLCQLV